MIRIVAAAALAALASMNVAFAGPTPAPKDAYAYIGYPNNGQVVPANKPFRVHLRAPGFAHLSSMDAIVRGYMLPDVVAMIGTYDVVFGEIDR